MFGFLNINKPPEMTSRFVVNIVQQLIRPVKVGHAGTLDPLATGVLVLGIGRATRLMEYVHALPKTYRGTFRLGCTSDTEDIQGEVVTLANAKIPTPDQLEHVVAEFRGTQWQQPPVYSALKINGQRAFDLARQGKEVKLKPREITVHRLELVEYVYPHFVLEIQCSSGTYVRSLGRDIGKRVQSGAVMTALQRQAIGNLNVQQCRLPEFVNAAAVQQALINPVEVLTDQERVCVTAEQMVELSFGRTIEIANSASASECFAIDEHGSLLAVLAPVDRQQGVFGAMRTVRPVRYFG